MSEGLNLPLTDELRSFIDSQSGDGTLYSTADEFVRDVLREKKHRLEAAALREGVLAGYQDILAGRTATYEGSVRKLLKDRPE